MPLAISLTTSDIYTALRSYLKSVLNLTDDAVRRAYVDDIPLPENYPFVYVTISSPKRNSTNGQIYDTVRDQVAKGASYILDVQLDFYGQDSLDLAMIVNTLFRDKYSVDYFDVTGLVPLYTDGIIQTSSEDEKGNFMVRNNLTLHFNIQPTIIVTQDYFENAEIDVKEAKKVI